MVAALRSVLPSFSLAESERKLIIPARLTDASRADVMPQLPTRRPSVGQGSLHRHSRRAGQKRYRDADGLPCSSGALDVVQDSFVASHRLGTSSARGAAGSLARLPPFVCGSHYPLMETKG